MQFEIYMLMGVPLERVNRLCATLSRTLFYPHLERAGNGEARLDAILAAKN